MFHAVYLNGGKIKEFKPINYHECVYKYSRNASGVEFGRTAVSSPPPLLSRLVQWPVPATLL